jgi:chemotaxis protein CheD
VIENVRVVHIGDVLVSDTQGDVLAAYGIGSCVVVCMYDPMARAGGMLHALLPAAVNGNKGTGSLARFVDRGVPLLIDALLDRGAIRSRLIAYLCGGARMFVDPGLDDLASIGERNVLSAEDALQRAGIEIVAQATRERIGRTVKLHVATGLVSVRAVGQGERALNAKPENS